MAAPGEGGSGPARDHAPEEQQDDGGIRAHQEAKGGLAHVDEKAGLEAEPRERDEEGDDDKARDGEPESTSNGQGRHGS